jgi:RNA polymerase sigma-70 factor (ECF subfamily)
VEAGQNDSPRQAEALERLCRLYQQPVFAYFQRRKVQGLDPEDLKQGFFENILQRESLKQCGPLRYKQFRAFLLGAMANYLNTQIERARTEKRGGANLTLSLEQEAAENRPLPNAAVDPAPDSVFDRQWALTVMNKALARVEQEYTADKKETRFAELKVFLSRDGSRDEYTKVGEKLEMTSDAVKVAVHRLRQDYGNLICAEVDPTVASPIHVGDEVRYLVECLTHQPT